MFYCVDRKGVGFCERFYERGNIVRFTVLITHNLRPFLTHSLIFPVTHNIASSITHNFKSCIIHNTLLSVT